MCIRDRPWVGKNMENAQRYGKFGEIMPQDEFLLLMQACDAFELLYLDKAFVAATKDKLAADPVITEDIMAKVLEGIEGTEIKRLVDEEHAEPLYHMGNLVGCVKRAHDVDVNLSAHVMFENIACKASSVLAPVSYTHLYVQMLQSQGLMHDTYVYGVDAKRTLSTIMNPTEGMDGAIVSGNCVSACDKNTTYHHLNNPVVKELFAQHGKTLNFVGMILTNENVYLADKQRSSDWTAKLCRWLDLDLSLIHI